jgi:leucyl/phenylalanyl-tRNA--protein transferase
MSRHDTPIIPPELLLQAYRAGIFPMSDSRDDPEVYWVEPRMRAILPLDGFHLAHSLARTLRRGRFRVTCNEAFGAVIDACAAPRIDAEDSWISQRIAESYRGLHRHGHAHSIEVWQKVPGQDGPNGPEVLVGGLYGVGFGRVFCGESMFSRASDASKVALAWLVAALRRAGAELLDCQFTTPHLASLGAVEIPQAHYLDLLRAALTPQAGGESAAGALSGAAGAGVAAAGSLPAGFAALLEDAAAAGLSSSPGNFIAQSLTHTS